MKEQLIRAQSLSTEALQAGDPAELGRMVEIFMEPVYRLCLRMTGNEQDAEDATQETFIKVIRSIQGFEGRSSLATWIYRIAVNESLMSLRRGKPLSNVVEIDKDAEQGEDGEIQIVDWAMLPEVELMSAEGKLALDQAILNLPESLRSVFILRDLQDLSIEETASALELSIANVKTRLLRARLKLRQELSLYYKERVSKEVEL